MYLNLASKNLKRLLILFAFIFAIFIIYDLIFSELNQFDSIPIAVESIFILIGSVVILYEKIIVEENILNPIIWITSGFVLFFAGTFFLFMLSRANFQEDSFSITYSYVLSSFKIISLILISIGLSYELKVNLSYYTKLQKI